MTSVFIVPLLSVYPGGPTNQRMNSKKQRRRRYQCVYMALRLHAEIQSSFGEKIISQLRTGCVELNDYLENCNIKKDANCVCGEKETINHYLIECAKLENLFSSFNFMSNLYLHESNYGRIGSRLART